MTLLATSGVSNDDAGLASGLFNSAQQVGGSLGLAILSTLAADHTANLISHGATGQAAVAAATVSGYQLAFTAAAVMLGTGAILMTVLLRRRHLEGIRASRSPPRHGGRPRGRCPTPEDLGGHKAVGVLPGAGRFPSYAAACR